MAKDEKLQLRLSSREKAEIAERAVAVGLTLSEYVLRRALCQPLVPSNGGAKEEHPTDAPRGTGAV